MSALLAEKGLHTEKRSNSAEERIIVGRRRRFDFAERKKKTSFDNFKPCFSSLSLPRYSEPNSYMCSTCKNKYSSAWRLVQHVQHSHGVNIYIDSALSSQQQHYNQGKSSSSNSSSSKNNVSSSSSSSSGSASLSQQQQQLQQTNNIASAIPRLNHPILPAPEMHPNPFGLLKMPLPPALAQQVSHGSVFSRNHDFRMDQFEQFRHHGLNLAAAAVAAANQLSQNSLQDRASSSGGGGVGVGKVNVSSIPPMEAQLDFYSQRLRQLAGTTSPNTILNAAPICSPSPRKQQHSPNNFASPSPSQLPPTPLTNNSRPHSITPPQKTSSGELTKENGLITTTPRSASTPPNSSSQSAESYLSCDLCDKRFKFQSALIVHRRQHTGEDTYKCSICDFSCTQISLLRRHKKLHQSSDDRNSNSGSVETENEDSPDDLDEDEFADNSVIDENEEEEAEDLSISNLQGGELMLDEKERNLLNSQSNAAASLVGELMDKFGLSNIAQYSEAYKQALQESGNALKLHLTNKDRDNNNTALSIPGLAEKLNGFPAALRLKEELLAKNMLQHPNSQLPQVPLFNPFENPFEASKRMKMDGNDSWWNLANFHHRNESLLENMKNKIPTSLSASHAASVHQQQQSNKRRNDTCEYCGKIFKNCSNLTVHRRSHTGEKPYKCELCSYACAQSSKLTRHMKTHGRLGKDVYRCRFCEMPFSVPSTLEKHMR